jgi:methylenetetrahydrofolate dehydrogenase (NADP+) / methenyltetrahydrofolate cyclohydrolase
MLMMGKGIADELLSQVKSEAALFKPSLGIILVGSDKPSEVYVRNKIAKAKEVGITPHLFKLEENCTENEVMRKVQELNADPKIDGFIVQLPLPSGMDQAKVISAVAPGKDIDGSTPENLGRLASGDKNCFAPPTAAGAIEILKRNGAKFSGADAVVVGRSLIVGKPLAMMLTNLDATVTVCHSKTRNLAGHTKNADILASATGIPGLITPQMVKGGAYAIDVGTAWKGGKIAGDMDADIAKNAHLTPVPGGVGPLTIAFLLKNTLDAAKNRTKK